jgi:hypothetical protein
MATIAFCSQETHLPERGMEHQIIFQFKGEGSLLQSSFQMGVCA